MNVLQKFHFRPKVIWVMTTRYVRFILLLIQKQQNEFGIIS